MGEEVRARRDRVDASGASILVVFSGLLGLNQALVKLVNEGFAPVFQSGLRSACAFFPVLLFALWMQRRNHTNLRIDDGTLVPGIVAGLLFAAEFCLLFIALEYTTVARVSLFFYTMPFWLAVAAHFLLPGEHLTLVRVGGLGLAVGGIAVAMLFRDGSTAGQEGAWIGDLLAVAGAVFWAGIALVIRRTKLSTAPPEKVMLYQLSVSAVVLLAIAPLFGDTVREVTPFLLGIFTFQVLVIAAAGFLVWSWALTVYPATDMASFSLLAPVFGVFFGWLIFNDPLPVSFMVALAMVVGGIFVVNRPR